MSLSNFRSLGGILVAYAVLSPSTASAKGIVLITWGETISHVGDVSSPNNQDPGPIKIGYKSSYFGVFWIDLWTWGGTYCVYDGKRYGPLQPAEAARLLGKQESDLSTPFLYRFPLGLLILGPLIVLGIIFAAVEKKGSGNEITLLFQDARYQKALAVLSDQYGTQPAVTEATQAGESQTTTDNDSRWKVAFEAGVQHLVGAGIPREEAERNLATMIQVLAQVQQQEATQAQQQEATAPAGGESGRPSG
jgi:hypothetical protein